MVGATLVTVGVSVNLTTGTGSGGFAEGDTLTSIENLGGTDFTDTLIGNFGANVLTGYDGGDILKGGAGADTLEGLDGDDFLWGGSGADTLSGGLGIDTLVYFAGGGGAADSVDTVGVIIVLDASGNGTVPSVFGFPSFAGGDTFFGIENVAGSDFDDIITGNDSVNVLSGQDGDDTLNGGGGGDTLDGDDGNDTYIVNNAGVTLIDFRGDEDTVLTSLSFTLGADFENLTLTSAVSQNGTGNAFANVIIGNNAVNLLRGLQGDDNLQGRLGNDNLIGGFGFDTLIGGFGRDTMPGGLNKDVFDFDAPGQTGKIAATRDIITDFQKGIDDIDLSTMDAKAGVPGNQAFSFIGTAAFGHVKGQLHIKFSGANTLVEGDIDGNGAADFQIQVNGHKVLTFGDFIL